MPNEHSLTNPAQAADRQRIFITCLGTTDYKMVSYTPLREGAEPTKTAFIQEARLRELLSGEPESTYEVVVLLTQGALDKNWSPPGKLESILDGMKSEFPGRLSVNDIHIPDANDLETQWKLFDIIVDKIPNHARVYFDMTHSFRTIPAVALQALTYAENLKRAELVELSYGAYEAAKPPIEPGSAPSIAPTWDLTGFMVVRDWSTALAFFKETGDTRPLAKLAGPLGKELGRTMKSDAPTSLRQLEKALTDFADAIVHCRSPKIGRCANQLRVVASEAAVHCSMSTAYKPVRRVLEKLSELLRAFPTDPGDHRDLRVQRAAIAWASSHGLNLQALTLLREGMVTAVVRVAGQETGKRSEEDDFFGAATAAYRGEQVRGEERLVAAANQFANDARSSADLKALLDRVQTVQTRRNALNHAATLDPTGNDAGSDGALRRLVEDALHDLDRVIAIAGALRPLTHQDEVST